MRITLDGVGKIGCGIFWAVILAGAVVRTVVDRSPERKAANQQMHQLSGEMESAIARLEKSAERLKNGTTATCWLDSRRAAMDYIVNTARTPDERRRAIESMKQIDPRYVASPPAKPKDTRREEEDSRDDNYDL